MTQAPRILVFDSGVGGLSILKTINEGLSGCHFIYASDNAAFPYGLKTQAYLIQRVDAVLKALIKRVQPDIIVVACNTASTLVLPSIRDHFKSPVVGVVPAIKPAAEQSRNSVIGLLGTPGTVNRNYTEDLIADFASDCDVIKVGSSRLVEIAEQALRGTSPNKNELTEILAPLFTTEKLDTIVLACTHFPLIIEALKSASPRTVAWIDSGQAIARRVASLISQPASPPDSKPVSKPVWKPNPENKHLVNKNCVYKSLSPNTVIQVIFTKATDEVEQLKPALIGFGCDDIAFCENIN